MAGTAARSSATSFWALGSVLAGGDDTHHHLAGDHGLAHKNMTDIAPQRGLVIGENVISFHPPEYRSGGLPGLLRLDISTGHGDQLVSSGPKKSGGWSLLRHGHRELGLISVTLQDGSGGNAQRLRVYPADALEGVGHPLALELRLQGIVHMHKITAAACAKVGTDRLGSVGRWYQNPFQPSVYDGFGDLDQFDFAGFAGNGAPDEYRPIFQPGHAESLAGAAGDLGGEYLIFVHRTASCGEFFKIRTVYYILAGGAMKLYRAAVLTDFRQYARLGAGRMAGCFFMDL